jgi:hypothetical protein
MRAHILQWQVLLNSAIDENLRYTMAEQHRI